MEPKFQSSFIPKSSGSTTANLASGITPRPRKDRSLFYTLAVLVFAVSAVMALVAFSYRFYLKYSINQMGQDLENARAALQLDTVQELILLDKRINATKELVSKHIVLTPVFELLENATPKTVRFTDFGYNETPGEIHLNLKGEARGYTALAVLSDVFNKSGKFQSLVFSNLTLNDNGDVIFNLEGVLDPGLVSYMSTIQ